MLMFRVAVRSQDFALSYSSTAFISKNLEYLAKRVSHTTFSESALKNMIDHRAIYFNHTSGLRSTFPTISNQSLKTLKGVGCL